MKGARAAASAAGRSSAADDSTGDAFKSLIASAQGAVASVSAGCLDGTLAQATATYESRKSALKDLIEISTGPDLLTAKDSLRLLVNARIAFLDAQEKARSDREEVMRADSMKATVLLENAVKQREVEESAARELRRQEKVTARRLANERVHQQQTLNVKRLQANAKMAANAATAASAALLSAENAIRSVLPSDAGPSADPSAGPTSSEGPPLRASPPAPAPSRPWARAKPKAVVKPTEVAKQKAAAKPKKSSGSFTYVAVGAGEGRAVPVLKSTAAV